MPKIIENLKNTILDEALDIVDREGMDALSIRRISARLNIAPSTIYNYYKNKDAVIGELTQIRWKEALVNIDKIIDEAGKVHGEEMVRTMDLIVEELKRTLRELLIFHASSAGSLKSSRTHAAKHIGMLAEELEKRVCRLFGGDAEDAHVKIMVNLVMACIHNNELKFSDIYETISSI